jgi:hypothetical protein
MQKRDKQITLLMQLITCQNSSGINGGHQNNELLVAMGITDVIITCFYYTLAGLVSPHSLKVGLIYLKTEAMKLFRT